MVSASHNPFADNGIKLFAPGGRKLADDVERALEADLEAILSGPPGTLPGAPVGAAVGSLRPDHSMVEGYVEHLISTLEGRRLDGLRVVLDTANGAASEIAPRVFRALGAVVETLHASPDGVNINAGCGSTHPESLRAAVVATGADAGFAFDGDADRCLAVDASGALVDGDEIMAMLALDLRAQGRLRDDTVVVTVMTNLGFKLAMAEAGVRVVETKVGDRYVLDALEAGGHSLGGEQSGHVILTDHASTGDGVLTALSVADLLVRSARPLAAHASVMERLPQVLLNVRGVDRTGLERSEAVWRAVAEVEAELGDRGRVLLRPSGTEPMVRVMVEAASTSAAEHVARKLAGVVEAELGSP
jgi:phosphoglucosamine mutase